MQINNRCPLDGDNKNDCQGCVYSNEYHFVDGKCIKRDAPSREKEFYQDLLMEQQEQM